LVFVLCASNLVLELGIKYQIPGLGGRSKEQRTKDKAQSPKTKDQMQTYFIELSYLLASVLFILGLKGLSHPETAKRGMHLAEFGMLMAIIGTLMHHEIVSYIWILSGLAIG